MELWLHLLDCWFQTRLDSHYSARSVVLVVALFLLVAFWRLIAALSKKMGGEETARRANLNLIYKFTSLEVYGTNSLGKD
jgi:uncharacterized membrane protein